jgi:predicted N-acetyltransferase YhbS
MIRIRRATAEDPATLTAIAHAAKRHWGYPERWIESWSDQLTVSNAYLDQHEVHVSIVEERPVGFYALERSGERTELGHLWVIPEMMGRGVGRTLFRHAVRRTTAAGVGAIEILSDPNAESFYEKMGARTVGRVDASMDGIERYLPRMQIDLAD